MAVGHAGQIVVVIVIQRTFECHGQDVRIAVFNLFFHVPFAAVVIGSVFGRERNSVFGFFTGIFMVVTVNVDVTEHASFLQIVDDVKHEFLVSVLGGFGQRSGHV